MVTDESSHKRARGRERLDPTGLAGSSALADRFRMARNPKVRLTISGSYSTVCNEPVNVR
ncbi:hypothetical protein GCM10009780_32130 [Actinomadura alba]